MQAVTSTISVSLLLILLGTIVLLSLTARVVADSVKENLTVTVVLDDDAQTIEGEQVQDTLKAKGYISSIEYISREQALQEQVESMGIDPTDLLGANPFPISMEVKVKPEYASSDSLQWISQELRSIKYVADVVYQKDLVESINRNLHRASLFLLAIALLLVVISLSLINNTVRLSVFNHRFVLHTMKLVGAKWSFIRRPFMARGFWIGLVSALIADAVIFSGIYWAARHDSGVLQYVTQENMVITALSVLGIGLVLTTLCTYFSTMTAYAIHTYRFKARKAALTFILAVMMIPTQVTALGFIQLITKMGLMDNYIPLIVPAIAAPATFFYMKQYMDSVLSMSLVEAARIDGAGEIQVFTRIYLPMCKGALTSVTILVFIDYWNMVEQPLILLKDVEKYPLSIFLARINNGEIGLAFAVAVIYMIPTLLLFAYGEDDLAEGISAQSGIKG